MYNVLYHGGYVNLPLLFNKKNYLTILPKTFTIKKIKTKSYSVTNKISYISVENGGIYEKTNY